MNDPELPIENVPVKKAAANVTKQPASITAEQPGTQTVTILASLPWTFVGSDCCMRYRAELWTTLDDDVYITFTHDDDCEIWRYIP